MVLITLRAAEEVRPAEFPTAEGELDPDMVAIATTIIERRSGAFDPSTFGDRYQEALRELAEAKLKGRSLPAKPTAAPPPVVDLMSALKRSLAQESGAPRPKPRRKAKGDRRQQTLLLPVPGKGGKRDAAMPTKTAPQARRRKA